MKTSTKLMKMLGNVLTNDKYPLDSLAEINTELGLIAYKSNKFAPKEEWAHYKLFTKIVEVSGNDNKRLRDLNSKTRYLLNGIMLSAKIKGKILEKIGYEVI